VSINSDGIEKAIGYVFEDAKLLEAALTHASLQKKEGDYERLEFLGDRVLGLVVAAMLYRAFPRESEGDLAKRHTALVQQKTLVDVALTLDLPSHLRLSSGEKKAGGLHKDTILSDAVEALIGAVYLDGGYARAETLVERLWKEKTAAASPPEDAKTQLQEWAQARGLPLPEYRVLSRSGSDHAPSFEVGVEVEGFILISAKASSKRQAEKDAAALMLKHMEGKT
jgi:ribonuclease-3